MKQHIEKKYVVDARAFVDRYRCSTCWGGLVADMITDDIHNEDYRNRNIHCENPDCTGAGFVTTKYVDRKLSEDRADYIEAKMNLGKTLHLPDPYKNQTIEDHLKALGF